MFSNFEQLGTIFAESKKKRRPPLHPSSSSRNKRHRSTSLPVLGNYVSTPYRGPVRVVPKREEKKQDKENVENEKTTK